jgi:DNA-binding beta-propeller fold protein YncE
MGRIIKHYNARIRRRFFNDVALDNHGNIYVSDTGTNTIYKLDTNLKNNTSLQVWLQSPELNSPNGLYVDIQ